MPAPRSQVIHYPGGKTKVVSSRSGSLPPPRRYSVSGPPSSVSYRSTTPASSRLTDIEARLDSRMMLDDYPVSSAPSMSLTQLRSKTTDARNKMDRHRTLLDRYLPINFGPEPEVEYEVAYKFGELADRMPILEPYRPNPDNAYTTKVEPYRPATKAARPMSEYAAKPPSGRSLRPEISDTRKRCRAVLCKTKGDPRYYDY